MMKLAMNLIMVMLIKTMMVMLMKMIMVITTRELADRLLPATKQLGTKVTLVPLF